MGGMRGVEYTPVVGKRGPKPRHGVSKRAFSTRLRAEMVAFLGSRANQAAWLESAIEAHPDYMAWAAEQPEEPTATHWCDGCRLAYEEAERLNSTAPILEHLRKSDALSGRDVS